MAGFVTFACKHAKETNYRAVGQPEVSASEIPVPADDGVLEAESPDAGAGNELDLAK